MLNNIKRSSSSQVKTPNYNDIQPLDAHEDVLSLFTHKQLPIGDTESLYTVEFVVIQTIRSSEPSARPLETPEKRPYRRSVSNKISGAHSGDPDQQPNLISVFNVDIKEAKVQSYPLSLH